MQVLFSARPQVCPVFLAARAKGRLQHALREAGTSHAFSRKVAVRTVGDNRIDEVEEYLRGQVAKEPCADERFRQTLRQFTIIDRNSDLSAATASRSGRYWYNLHLVLVVEGRGRIVDEERLRAVRDGIVQVAAEEGHQFSVLAVLPDHIHLALRGNIERSPEEIVLAFQNGLAVRLGSAVWSHNYYAGTFGAYNMEAVRRNQRVALAS